MAHKANQSTRKPMGTVAYVAWLLDCSERTVRRMCENGDIKAVKLHDNGKWRVNIPALCEQFGIEL